jgi:hypothetical protein
VDRVFSKAIVNGVYSFHASASAFAQFWNDSYWETQDVGCNELARCQVWAGFTFETICMIAKSSGYHLMLKDHLPISDQVRSAFQVMGEEGVIRSAKDHACDDCTHERKATADIIVEGDRQRDPAATFGVDEHREVPILEGQYAVVSAQETAAARAIQPVADVDDDIEMHSVASNDVDMVQMVVMDGVVMGHTVSTVHLLKI